MKNKYRIVTDRYLGFEVQIKYWWWPFNYYQLGINTHLSFDKALEMIEKHKVKTEFKSKIVKSEI